MCKTYLLCSVMVAEGIKHKKCCYSQKTVLSLCNVSAFMMTNFNNLSSLEGFSSRQIFSFYGFNNFNTSQPVSLMNPEACQTLRRKCVRDLE